MKLLDGKVVKKEILDDLKKKLNKLKDKLSLVVIEVGDDEASKVYVGQKEKMADSVGINFRLIKLSETATNEELFELIDELNNDSSVTGILVQMPLPKHLNAEEIQNRVLPSKDVDGLNDLNAGKLLHNSDEALVPCTAEGIIDILEYYDIGIKGSYAVVVGRSDLVGKPVANLLTNMDATVTLCHSKTKNLKEITKMADILIVAVGKANFIDADYVKDGAVIVDVGINRVDGKLVGDVDVESVKDKVSYITPVPGGVGQLTVANLGKNVYKAYSKKK